MNGATVDGARALEVLVTAGLSLFVSLVAFRTRLYAMSRDIAEARNAAKRDLDEATSRDRARLDSLERAVSTYGPTLKLIDRRTLYILQILAEQASDNGKNRRVPDDLLVRMLADEKT